MIYDKNLYNFDNILYKLINEMEAKLYIELRQLWELI